MEKPVYKLVASDLDSTMITDKLEIPAANIIAVERARRTGCHVVICSGRATDSIMPFEQRLGLIGEGCYGISFNGGVVYETATRAKVRDIRLGRNIALEILKELEDCEVCPLAYVGDKIYVVHENDFVRRYVHYVKIPCEAVESFSEIEGEISLVKVVENMEKLMLINEQFSRCSNASFNKFFSSEFLLEFSAKGATKGEALLFLADLMGVPAPQTIAIGDNLNDITMFETAGLGVAVSNGHSELKALADYVTSRHCSEGAVAEVIERYIL